MTRTSPLKADRIGPNAHVVIDGTKYLATRPTSRGWELASVGPRPQIRLLSHAEVERGEEDGSIVVIRPRQDSYAVASMSLPARRDMFIKDTWMRLIVAGLRDGTLASTGDKALTKFVSGHTDEVRSKVAAWERDAHYDHAGPRKRKPNVGTAHETVELAPSTRHLRRLLKRYEEGHRHPLSMRKHTEASGKGGRRVSPYVRSLVSSTAQAYASEVNPTIAGLHQLIKARIVLHNADKVEALHERVPAERTVARIIRDLPEGQKIGGRRNGERGIHRMMGPVTAGTEYHRVGERSEHDCWNIPLFLRLKKAGVIDEVPANIRDQLQALGERITVAVVADKATGYITGMRFGLSESSQLTLAALRMSLTDKSRYAAWAGCEAPWDLYSGIEEGATDSGPAYTSNAFLSAAIPAFGSHVYTAGGLPHLRGLIEGIFSTMHKSFISKSVARAFENVVAKGDYEAQKRAALTLDQFFRLMIRYVVDVYHNMPRYGGLRKSPRREYEEKAARMDTKPPPTSDEIRVWFGIELTRKLGPEGIRFMHIRYDSNWLVKYRIHMGLEEVTIRVDEEDLGTISVLLDGDWITVPARDREYRGVTLADWMAMLEDIRKRFGEEADVDFRRYVAPALVDIERLNRRAEREMKLLDVTWTAETLAQAEDRLFIRPVHDDDASGYAEAPSFGAGTLGRRFDRQAGPPAAPTTEPDHQTPSESVPPRRRLRTIED